MRSSAARTARSASPSVATGVPHTAMTASPMNFSTTPPYRRITVLAASKYAESSSRTSSGSRASDSGVKPTRSQNRTEHIRRSATGTTAAWAGTTATSSVPQWPQNLACGATGRPQDGQPWASGLPHSMQNRSPASLWAPHEVHSTRGPPGSPPSVRDPERTGTAGPADGKRPGGRQSSVWTRVPLAVGVQLDDGDAPLTSASCGGTCPMSTSYSTGTGSPSSAWCSASSWLNP